MARKTAEPEIPSTALVLPGTGEVVDLANPADAAHVYFQLGVLETQVKEARYTVRDALLDHTERYGGNTMPVAGAEVKVTRSDEIAWDLDVLAELREAGLPEARWDALVQEVVTTRVNATVAKQIAKANPAYALIIDRALTRHPKRPSVTVTVAPS